MKIAFSGHRDRKANPADVLEALAAYPDATVIHGGAKGFDTQVHELAIAGQRTVQVFRPDYRQHGRAAPLKRNTEMLAQADLVVALYDGRHTGGTYSTIQKARKVGVPVILLHPTSP